LKSVRVVFAEDVIEIAIRRGWVIRRADGSSDWISPENQVVYALVDLLADRLRGDLHPEAYPTYLAQVSYADLLQILDVRVRSAMTAHSGTYQMEEIKFVYPRANVARGVSL
jgi:hypothetical protein